MTSYILGILLSFMLFKFDRKNLILKLKKMIVRRFKNTYIRELLILLCILVSSYVLFYFTDKLTTIWDSKSFPYIGHINFSNIIAMVLLIDFSYTEKIILKWDDSSYCHELIKSLSSSLTFGFVAPLIFLSLTNNFWALVFCSFMILTPRSLLITGLMYKILAFLPCTLVILCIYILLAVTGKLKSSLSYKGMFIKNLYFDPMINIYISVAFLMGTFMIIDYQNIYDHRVVKYGLNRNIKKVNLYTLLTKSYLICILNFLIFLVLEI